MIDMQADLSNFERVLTRVADTTGATSYAPGNDGRKFMRYQAQQLVKTLMNLTPPRKKAGLEKRLRKKVSKSFVADPNTATLGKENIWLFSTSNFLYGVPRDYDQRGASVKEASRLLFADLAKPTLTVNFLGSKARKQRVKIFRKWLVGRRTFKDLTTYLVKHVGRLKAGWLPSWHHLGIPGQPPAWVERHKQGAKGLFIDGFFSLDNPNCTLVNFAAGAGNKQTQNAIRAALRVRSKAMVTDMKLIIAGKKQRGWA